MIITFCLFYSLPNVRGRTYGNAEERKERTDLLFVLEAPEVKVELGIRGDDFKQTKKGARWPQDEK